MTKLKLSKKEKEAYSTIGKVGGKANAKKGKAHFSRIGKLGADKRWHSDVEKFKN